jgi:hypothetical protein
MNFDHKPPLKAFSRASPAFPALNAFMAIPGKFEAIAARFKTRPFRGSHSTRFLYCSIVWFLASGAFWLAFWLNGRGGGFLDPIYKKPTSKECIHVGKV